MKKLTVLNGVLVLILIFFFFPYRISNAATYYVDSDHSSASNSNPGTLELPWLTIQYAASALLAGDTAYIRAGTYNEHVYMENEGNTTDGHIVFSAYPGEIAVIDGTGVTESQNGIILTQSYIKLIGLELCNWNDNAIWIENSAFFEISDCKVHDVAYGIGVADGSHDFVFNRVEAHHFDLYGFDVSTSGGGDCYNGTFNDCVAHSARDPQQNVDGFALGHGTQDDFILNRCRAFDVFDGFDISSRNTLLNSCLAYNCWNGAYKIWQDNVVLVNCIGHSSGVSNVELDWDGTPGVTSLVNCTFSNAQTYTVWIENAADTLQMYNCILSGGNNIGLAFEQIGVGNYRGDYNIFHNEDPNRAIVVGYEDEFSLNQIDAGVWTTYSSQDTHSLVAYSDTSLFVDPANSDLHLTETSPAVDNGTSDGSPSYDFDGNQKPSGDGYDIGAYEYQGSVGIFGNEILDDLSTSLFLHNYPNPFNRSTIIKYKLYETDFVTLKIYNLSGQELVTLVNGYQIAGVQEMIWTPKGLPSGIYLYRLQTSKCSKTKKLILQIEPDYQ